MKSAREALKMSSSRTRGSSNELIQLDSRPRGNDRHLVVQRFPGRVVAVACLAALLAGCDYLPFGYTPVMEINGKALGTQVEETKRLH